jgi:type I restriction enzyme R subunit
MLVCIDKVTCARMLSLILPRWQAKVLALRQEAEARRQAIDAIQDEDARQRLHAQRDVAGTASLDGRKPYLGLIISEAQNEMAEFKRWGFDIIPHRER